MGYIFAAVYTAVFAAAIIISWWLLIALLPVFLIHASVKQREHIRARRARGLEE
jgi:4-hydroxybenzoate polyprenyltransferase